MNKRCEALVVGVDLAREELVIQVQSVDFVLEIVEGGAEVGHVGDVRVDLGDGVFEELEAVVGGIEAHCCGWGFGFVLSGFVVVVLVVV